MNPGGTVLGEKLREMLLHDKMNLETEALLMFAARREHIAEVIEPALQRGDWVISDRFTDASFAYQGGGRGLDLHKMRQLEEWVHPHLQPIWTLLFDVLPEVAQARLEAAVHPTSSNGKNPDSSTGCVTNICAVQKNFPTVSGSSTVPAASKPFVRQ